MTKAELIEKVRAVSNTTMSDDHILVALNQVAKEYRAFRETEPFLEYVIREAADMVRAE